MLIALLFLFFVIFPLVACVWRFANDMASGKGLFDEDDKGRGK